MTTVVTGASGHIGANLIRSLIAQGRRVRVLLHQSHQALDGLDVEAIQGDVRDPESLLRAFTGAEVVYHLAARVSIEINSWHSLEAINVIGTRNVIEACLNCGVDRLIHFSSVHAMEQKPLHIPVDESRPLAASANHQPYDRSKAAGEKEVRLGIEKGLNAVILNPTAIIGPQDFQLSHFGQVLLSLAQRKLPALVDGGFDWVDVRDVVYGAMQAEKLAPAGAKYLLSGHWAPLAEIARIVEETTGVEAPRFVAPLWLASLGAPFMTTFDHLRHERPLYTRASLQAINSNRHISHDKASKELGYQPRPLKETIVDSLKWFKDTGRLVESPR